jgi:hypothetical protein
MSDDGINFRMRVHGVPVVVSESTPLRKTKHIATDDYEAVEIESDALCLIMDGKVYVHPDRWHHFEALKGVLP